MFNNRNVAKIVFIGLLVLAFIVMVLIFSLDKFYKPPVFVTKYLSIGAPTTTERDCWKNFQNCVASSGYGTWRNETQFDTNASYYVNGRGQKLWDACIDKDDACNMAIQQQWSARSQNELNYQQEKRAFDNNNYKKQAILKYIMAGFYALFTWSAFFINKKHKFLTGRLMNYSSLLIFWSVIPLAGLIWVKFLGRTSMPGMFSGLGGVLAELSTGLLYVVCVTISIITYEGSMAFKKSGATGALENDTPSTAGASATPSVKDDEYITDVYNKAQKLFLWIDIILSLGAMFNLALPILMKQSLVAQSQFFAHLLLYAMTIGWMVVLLVVVSVTLKGIVRFRYKNVKIEFVQWFLPIFILALPQLTSSYSYIVDQNIISSIATKILLIIPAVWLFVYSVAKIRKLSKSEKLNTVNKKIIYSSLVSILIVLIAIIGLLFYQSRDTSSRPTGSVTSTNRRDANGYEQMYAYMASKLTESKIDLAHHAEKLCEKIYPYAEYDIKYVQSACFWAVAINTKNPQLCEFVKDASTLYVNGSRYSKENCLTEISRGNMGVEEGIFGEGENILKDMGYSKNDYRGDHIDFFVKNLSTKNKDFQDRLDKLPDQLCSKNNPQFQEKSSAYFSKCSASLADSQGVNDQDLYIPQPTVTYSRFRCLPEKQNIKFSETAKMVFSGGGGDYDWDEMRQLVYYTKWNGEYVAMDEYVDSSNIIDKKSGAYYYKAPHPEALMDYMISNNVTTTKPIIVNLFDKKSKQSAQCQVTVSR